ncbi:MAG: RNA polymerase sigma factor [Deltaproteobacteria bacterium]|nr:RNA polymerase sigma factor [Deltaproteobacteria bacterium]
MEVSADLHAIYREHFQYCYRTLRRLGVPARDLPDVTHDVFMVVHRRLPDFERGRPIKPWLFGIAYRVAADRSRRFSTQRERLEEGPEPVDSSDNALLRLERAEAQRLVELALEKLDLEKRAVFVAHELEGQAAPEIAAALGIPLNTVYSRLRVARDTFSKVVRRLAAKEPS